MNRHRNLTAYWAFREHCRKMRDILPRCGPIMQWALAAPVNISSFMRVEFCDDMNDN